MNISKVALRYAGALADLSMETQQQGVIQEELRYYSELMGQSPDLYTSFSNPAVSQQQKERVLEALLTRTRPSLYTGNFLRLLLRNDRLHNLQEIYQAFLQELDSRRGIATAKVTAARPLRDDEKHRLRVQLEKLTRKGIRLEVEVNPGILGGVTARIGSEIYDGSVLTQLENLQRQLSQ